MSQVQQKYVRLCKLTCVSLRSPSPQEIHVRKSVGSWFQTKPAQQTDVRNSSRSEKTENLTDKHLFLAGSLMQGLTTPLLDKKRVSTKYQSVSNELLAPKPVVAAHCAGDRLGNSCRNECKIPEQQKKLLLPSECWNYEC